MRNGDTARGQAAEEQPLLFSDDHGCFGCSASNAAGLQMRFRRRGDVVVADHTIAERFHGAPGIAHGGIIAALLDEVSCAAAFALRNVYVVTGELSVRYRRPCPVKVLIALSARVAAQHARYVTVEAELRRAGELLAASSGKFFFAT